MKVTLIGAKLLPRLNEIAYRLESEGLEVSVSPYASFGPQVFIEYDSFFGKREVPFGITKIADRKTVLTSSSQFVEPPVFSQHPPTFGEVVKWLSNDLKESGYAMDRSSLYKYSIT